jgi:excisionase family DNA binding protein
MQGGAAEICREKRCAMQSEEVSVMTVDEVAEYLRIPRSSLYKLAQEGRIPCQKVGRHWRFRREAIDVWLGEHGRQREADGPVSGKRG